MRQVVEGAQNQLKRHHWASPRQAEALKRRGIKHLEFCCNIYLEQVRGGRYFVHEHPLTATSWQVECMDKLRKMPMVYTAEGHMCAYGMTSADQRGPGFVKKPTRFLTNSIGRPRP